MQSWTTTQGTGEVVITPSSVDGGGSHFATPMMKRVGWRSQTFIPCALVSSTNQLSGNSANLNNEGSLGATRQASAATEGSDFTRAGVTDEPLECDNEREQSSRESRRNFKPSGERPDWY